MGEGLRGPPGVVGVEGGGDGNIRQWAACGEYVIRPCTRMTRDKESLAVLCDARRRVARPFHRCADRAGAVLHRARRAPGSHQHLSQVRCACGACTIRHLETLGPVLVAWEDAPPLLVASWWCRFVTVRLLTVCTRPSARARRPRVRAGGGVGGGAGRVGGERAAGGLRPGQRRGPARPRVAPPLFLLPRRRSPAVLGGFGVSLSRVMRSRSGSYGP